MSAFSFDRALKPEEKIVEISSGPLRKSEGPARRRGGAVTVEQVAQVKEEATAAFAAKDFKLAAELWGRCIKALESASSSSPTSTTRSDAQSAATADAETDKEGSCVITTSVPGQPSQLPALYANRSAAHMSLHLFSEALADAEKAVSLAPQWPKAFFRLGMAFAAKGLPLDACKAYRQSIQLRPEAEGDLRATRSRLVEKLFELFQGLACGREIKANDQMQPEDLVAVLYPGAIEEFVEVLKMDEEPVLQCTAALQLAALAPALDHKHDYFASGGAADNAVQLCNYRGKLVIHSGATHGSLNAKCQAMLGIPYTPNAPRQLAALILGNLTTFASREVVVQVANHPRVLEALIGLGKYSVGAETSKDDCDTKLQEIVARVLHSFLSSCRGDLAARAVELGGVDALLALVEVPQRPPDEVFDVEVTPPPPGSPPNAAQEQIPKELLTYMQTLERVGNALGALAGLALVSERVAEELFAQSDDGKDFIMDMLAPLIGQVKLDQVLAPAFRLIAVAGRKDSIVYDKLAGFEGLVKELESLTKLGRKSLSEKKRNMVMPGVRAEAKSLLTKLNTALKKQEKAVS